MKARINVVASPLMPGGRFLLVTGKLSAAAGDELRRRVKAGEVEASVYAELLVREKKAVVGWTEPEGP